MFRKFNFLILVIVSTLVLSSCSSKSYKSSKNDIKITSKENSRTSFNDFIKGNAVLPKGIHSFESIENIVNEFKSSRDTGKRDYFLHNILDDYPESDIAYYILGSVAESQGFLHAAKTYFKRSKDEKIQLKFCNTSQRCPIIFQPKEALVRVENAIAKICPKEYISIIDVTELDALFDTNNPYLWKVNFDERSQLIINGKVYISNCLANNKLVFNFKRLERLSASFSPSSYDETNPFNLRMWLARNASNIIDEHLIQQKYLKDFSLFWSWLDFGDKIAFKSHFADHSNKLIRKIEGSTSFESINLLITESVFSKQLFKSKIFPDQLEKINEALDNKFAKLIYDAKDAKVLFSLLNDCLRFRFLGVYCKDKIFSLANSSLYINDSLAQINQFEDLPDSAYVIGGFVEKMEDSRRVIKHNNISSQYVSDTYTIPNAKFSVAETEYELAIVKYESYMANEYNKPYRKGGFLSGVADGFSRASEKRELSERVEFYRDKLLNTPPTIRKDVLSTYKFKLQTIEASLKGTATIYLLNKENKWFKKIEVPIHKTKMFEIAHGTRGDDSFKYASEEDIEFWIQDSQSIQFNELKPNINTNFSHYDKAFNPEVLNE